VDEFDQARRNHSADGTWQVRGPGMQACSIASMGPVSATEVGSATADQRFLSWIFEVTKRPVQFFKKIEWTTDNKLFFPPVSIRFHQKNKKMFAHMSLAQIIQIIFYSKHNIDDHNHAYQCNTQDTC